MEKVGQAFYLLDASKLQTNYDEFYTALSRHYKKVQIAYSYKTNFTPYLCRALNRYGAWAEIVSEMELDMAIKNGVQSNRIIFNGPVKTRQAIHRCLHLGIVLQIDNLTEWSIIEQWVTTNVEKLISVALRINYNSQENAPSRFGLSLVNGDFSQVIERIKLYKTVALTGLHIHYIDQFRTTDSFVAKLHKLINVMAAIQGFKPKYLNIGGGFFSEMTEGLKKQFELSIPSLTQYGEALSFAMKGQFADDGPILLVEPGAALVANTTTFVCCIWEIKKGLKQNYAFCTGSKYNIKPTLHNRQVDYYRVGEDGADLHNNLCVSGYTCQEEDVLIENYNGKLTKGDFLIFENLGAYVQVLKPPFIEPDFPVLAVEEDFKTRLIRRKQTYDDILGSYL